MSYPVTRLSLVKYCGASGDFNVIHWNERIARSVGLPNVIAHGMFTMAQAGRYVTDWAGDAGALVEFGVRFSAPVVVPDDDTGATIEVSGTVEEKLDGNLRGGRAHRAVRRRQGADPRPRGRPPALAAMAHVPPDPNAAPSVPAGPARRVHHAGPRRARRGVSPRRTTDDRTRRRRCGPRTSAASHCWSSAAAATSSSPTRAFPAPSCTSPRGASATNRTGTASC